MEIKTPSDFGRIIKQGRFAWPGGYPLYFITSDCAPICFECAKTEGQQICRAIRDNEYGGWKIAAVDVNWEDPNLCCDHCAKRIESAYAEDEEIGGKAVQS